MDATNFPFTYFLIPYFMKITFDPRGIDDGFTLFPPSPTFKQWDPSGKFREASVTWPLSFKLWR